MRARVDRIPIVATSDGAECHSHQECYRDDPEDLPDLSAQLGLVHQAPVPLVPRPSAHVSVPARGSGERLLTLENTPRFRDLGGELMQYKHLAAEGGGDEERACEGS